jgi:hypothetical protein
MNLENFERLKKAIMDNAESLDIDSWAEYDASSPCGTVGCIAGFCDWLMAVDGVKNTVFSSEGTAISFKEVDNIRKNAASFLAISLTDADLLFFARMWPSDLLDRYDKASTANQRSNAVIKRIDHFIKHGE